MHTCLSLYIRIYIYIYTYAYAYVNVYIYVCICRRVHVYICCLFLFPNNLKNLIIYKVSECGVCPNLGEASAIVCGKPNKPKFDMTPAWSPRAHYLIES